MLKIQASDGSQVRFDLDSKPSVRLGFAVLSGFNLNACKSVRRTDRWQECHIFLQEFVNPMGLRLENSVTTKDLVLKASDRLTVGAVVRCAGIPDIDFQRFSFECGIFLNRLIANNGGFFILWLSSGYCLCGSL